MATEIITLKSAPGVKRDGTMLEGDNYVAARWCRFQRGMPRKMGGYRSINKYLQHLPRSLYEYMKDDLTYVHAGSATAVERFVIDGSYNTSVITDRTPAALTANSNNLWTFDADHDGANLNLLAHVAPNLECVCSSGQGQLFIGGMFALADLTQVSTFPAGYSLSGGIVALHPYTVGFGNDGFVMWTPDFTDWTVAGAGSAYVTGQKIIRGMPMRGGPGYSPAGLLWSSDSLLRMSYVGGTQVFQFDTLTTQSSILASNSVIDYDGIFYWLGRDRFLMFNGVVKELPNDMNLNFFFDELNYDYRQRIFTFKIPRYGEIWWCFPRGDSTEPNHAIVYNVRENTWYDTALPGEGRGAALSALTFPKPLMSGVEEQDYNLTGVTVVGGGTGYTVGDVLDIVGGAGQITAQITVATVSVGVITAVTISNAGRYTSTPSNPAAVTGPGNDDATFTLTWTRPYKFWVHEVGTDMVDGTDISPIQSYFETSDISLPSLAGQNKAVEVLCMEPDFVQTGDMTVRVKGRSNSRAGDISGPVKTFVANPTTPEEQIVYFKEQRRELRFLFESNTVGGDYQMGQTLVHVQPGDGTLLGAVEDGEET